MEDEGVVEEAAFDAVNVAALDDGFMFTVERLVFAEGDGGDCRVGGGFEGDEGGDDLDALLAHIFHIPSLPGLTSRGCTNP